MTDHPPHSQDAAPPTPTTPSDIQPVQRLALSREEAAKALGVSERHLWTYTNCGEIPHIRIGNRVLYPVDMLYDWMDKQAKGVQR